MTQLTSLTVSVGLDRHGRSITLARRPVGDGGFEYALYRLEDASAAEADEFYGLSSQILQDIGRLVAALDEARD